MFIRDCRKRLYSSRKALGLRKWFMFRKRLCWLANGLRVRKRPHTIRTTPWASCVLPKPRFDLRTPISFPLLKRFSFFQPPDHGQNFSQKRISESNPERMRKKSIEQIALKPFHFKGVGAITRSDSNRVLKTEYF